MKHFQFIFKVNLTIPSTYILNDVKGNVFKGAFYEQELLRTKVEGVYLVEKILRKIGNRVLVRWKGFDKSAIYVRGKLSGKKADGTNATCKLVNNTIAFLFDSIR